MSDVRALLRSERAVRRISHPQAQYSSTGALLCRVCRLPLKAESLWELHVRSKQHKINSQKHAEQQEVCALNAMEAPEAGAPAASADVDLAASNSRKRKASFEGREAEELPKAQKLAQLSRRVSADAREEQEVQLKGSRDESEFGPEAEEGSQSKETVTLVNMQPEPQSSEAMINEDEWKAFEREVASIPLQQNGVAAALSSAATIEAKPLSAEEVAAQAREEQSRQQETKEVEMEEEKEDSARKFEDELDEMEELELRVRRLRDKREAIRRAKDVIQAPVNDTDTTKQQSNENELYGELSLRSAEDATESTDEESDEENWDAWRLK